MGYGELLRVLEEEAAREGREVREAASREAERIVAEARGIAAGATGALRERERSVLDGRLRAAREAGAAERARALLAAERRALDELREEAARRLPAPAGPEVLAGLVAEVAAEIGEGPFALEVDHGEEAVAREMLARARPDAAARAEIRTAAVPRGGVALFQGRRVLDDTLPSRLARAWPALEPELARILFAEGR